MKWIKCCALDVLEEGYYAFSLKNKITGIRDIVFETRDKNTCVAYFHATHYFKIELPELPC